MLHNKGNKHAILRKLT